MIPGHVLCVPSVFTVLVFPRDNKGVEVQMTEQDSTDKTVILEEPEIQQEEQVLAPKEYGGPKGKEPTRYGDWEKNGRCIDF